MRTTWRLSVPAVAFVCLCSLVGAAQASAVATGICEQTPEAGTKRCVTGTYYPANETFKSNAIETIKITDGANTIKCQKSKIETKTGTNPNNTSAVTTQVEGVTFEECKVGATACTLTSPDATETKFPWAGSWQWTLFGTTGPNGEATIKTFSIHAKCGAEEAVYIGDSAESSIVGKFYNADDTNKPVASTRAEIKFDKSAMRSRKTIEKKEVEEKGLTFSGVYTVEPTNASKNAYLSNG